MEQNQANGAARVTTEPERIDPDAADRAEQAAQSSGVLEQPEVLSLEKHGELRVDRAANVFTFAKKMHMAPITLEEFAPACAHYPIVFVGEQRSPCVVMGVARGENAFIDDAGAFPKGSYVPAYFRQHPFLFAKDSKGERNLVLIDAASRSLSTTTGEPLFNDGKPSQYLTTVYTFLAQLQNDWARTKELTEYLKEHDLFETRSITVRGGARNEPVSQPFRFLSINAEKINDMDAEALKALAKPGWLQAIYAQQASLHAWPRLHVRARGSA